MANNSRVRGIVFSKELLPRVMDGSKTVMRRLMNPQPVQDDFYTGCWAWKTKRHTTSVEAIREGKYPDVLPHSPGDVCYVKEGLRLDSSTNNWTYSADGVEINLSPNDQSAAIVWAHHKENNFQTSRFMPKWAARTWLDIIDVRPERLQDITEEDAKREGVKPWEFNPDQPLTSGERAGDSPYRSGFAYVWDCLHDDAAWKANPWVWRIEFRFRAGGAE